MVEALDEYVDNIKTLPRNWNIKNYIEPPAGEHEKEKELQEDVENAIDELLSILLVTPTIRL